MDTFKAPVFKVLVISTILSLILLFIGVFHTYNSPTTGIPWPWLEKPQPKFFPSTGIGVVLNLRYWEQMGNAASNLMNSQCWAGMMGMDVVEPSILESIGQGDTVFYFDKDYRNTERFRDLFDISRWNRYAKEHQYSSLISVKDFLEKGSKNLIFVQVQYSTSKCIMHNSQSLLFLNSLGFKTVRKVCLDLLHEGRLRTQQELTEQIFGSGLGNFTVVFSEWRGIRNEHESEGKLSNFMPGPTWYRTPVKDSPCDYGCIDHQPYYKTWLPAKREISQSDNKSIVSEYNATALRKGKVGFIPSDRVLANTAEFRAKYMNNEPYIAIMMRMENLHKGIASDSSYAKCLETAKNLWKYASQKYGINRTFITSDLGKYGSQSWSQASQKLSAQFQKDIIKTVGLSPSFVDISIKNIEAVTGSTGRVKVAWTQSILAAEAKCVIFLGGGSIQGLVLNIHSAMYVGRECFVYLDTYCQQYAKLGFE